MNMTARLNSYWLLLKDLSAEEKQSLVDMLLKSLPTGNRKRAKEKKMMGEDGKNWPLRFAGSWSDFPETADELIEKIEHARTLGRSIEAI